MHIKTHRQGARFIDATHCRYRYLRCPILGPTAWRVIAEPRSPTAKRWVFGGARLLETFTHEHCLAATVANIERMLGYVARREAAAEVAAISVA